MRYIIGILIFLGAIFLIGSKFYKHSSTPQQKKVQSITISGSDTLIEAVSAEAEAFSKLNPQVKISAAGPGSGAGIKQLINKQLDIADSSRAMTDMEISQAKARGLNPQQFLFAIDGITIITNPSNPIKSLTVDQLGKIYSGKITNWKELGGKDLAIDIYGRNTASGTYAFFRDVVVKNDYASTMHTMEGNQAIVDGVKVDASGIGYVGVAYAKDATGQARSDIHIVPVSKDESSTPVSPLDIEAVRQGIYPIARNVYQYLPVVPQKSSIIVRFLQFELSSQGEEIIKKTGFYKLSDADLQKNQQFFKHLK